VDAWSGSKPARKNKMDPEDFGVLFSQFGILVPGRETSFGLFLMFGLNSVNL
jgi:hypothetical protein